MAAHITGKDALNEALKNAGSKLVVIDFFATWCGPCRVIGPVIDKMVTEYPNVCFIKIDVDENEVIAEEYNVTVMPTFVFWKDGKRVHDMTGANEASLRTAIEKHRA